MKSHLAFILSFVSFQCFAQQSAPITLRENFFNNYTFIQNSEKIKYDQVQESMATYPATLKKFMTGKRNMNFGSGMRIATSVLLTSGLVYFIADDYSAQSGRFLLATGVAGTIFSFIGPGIREEGRRNISDAVQEYNYQVLQRQQIPISYKPFQVRNAYAFGWKFNF